ncbi:MAG: hypothetical protein H7837_04395 [Magnetococcus sp. MYC-9]
MRVTTNMMFSAGMTAMQTQQQEILQAQAESTSGMRIQKPSDDPSGSFRHLLFSSDLSAIQSLKRTTDLATQRLEHGDTSLGTVHNNLMQAYELAMQFSHGTAGNDPAILRGSSTSALAIYQNILTVANTEMDGVPLFGGGRTVTPFDESHLTATSVRVQSNGAGSLAEAPKGFVAHVADGFVVPDGQEGVKTLYKITPSLTETGSFDVTINGVNQDVPVSPIDRVGAPPLLDLGNGVTFDLGAPMQKGDAISFTVVPDGNRFQAMPTQLSLDETGAVSPVDVNTGFSAQVAKDARFEDLPLSIKVSYLSGTGEYAVNVNGIDWAPLKPVEAVPGRPAYLDFSNGITLNLVDRPQNGDVFYFEVVPAYQGGRADRPIQVTGGKSLPGNVTAGEWLVGHGPLGQGVNLLGAAAALRGAMLRGDSAEVAVQLDRLNAGRSQVSDFQSETGVRSTQMAMTASILATDETSLQTLKATNSEADLFDVLSRLQKATQTMQMLTTTERQVLNLSLIDFIR